MATTEVATVVSTKKLENILVEPVTSKPVPDHLTGTSKRFIELRRRRLSPCPTAKPYELKMYKNCIFVTLYNAINHTKL